MSKEQIASTPEITYVPHHEDSVFYRNVKRVTIWLTVFTLIELGCGLLIYNIGHGSSTAVLLIKGIVVICTLAKAFYITSYFMHLGDEIRNFAMTILVPLLLFIWFIAAFLWDGWSWGELRRTEGHSKPKTEQTTPAAIPPGAEN